MDQESPPTNASGQRTIFSAWSRPGTRTFIIWAIVGCIAAISCCLNMSSARLGNELLPMGIDAFYHARRILDAVPDLGAFYEFDPKIHAPEGSLLVWPWGYDYFMAGAVRLALAAGLTTQPLQALLWIPVVAVFVSVAFLVLIARRLGLSAWPTTLAALCIALAPSTQQLHGFGQIDHHFAEEMFLLASLWAGLAWLQTRSVASGVTLGAILGLSLGVHNGLFILQLPLLATLFAQWLQGNAPPRRPTIAFAVALVGAALAVLIPSDPFRMGRFEFYTLSWFHLYVACGTAVVALLLTWLRPSRNTMIALAALAVVLLLPLLNEIRIAQSFLQGSVSLLNEIAEVRSPLQRILKGESLWVTYFYSLLIWSAPLTFVVCMVQCWRERQSSRLLFWITAVFGLALLSMQIRMHYFGAFALYLPWLVLAHDYASRHAELAKRTFLIATLALLLAYIPQIRYTLVAGTPVALDEWFDEFHQIVPMLQKACAEDPGVVLADTDAGHYIRYYSDCSVVANNFLLTEQQFRKADEVARLLSLPPGEVASQAPYVKYVLIRSGRIVRKPEGGFNYLFFASGSSTLARALLFNPQDRVPPGYQLIAEVNLQMPGGERIQHLPYARLYKIQRQTPPAPSAHVVE